MLPFPRFLLLAAVAIGVGATIFFARPASEISVTQITPLEREQLRNQVRHPQIEWGKPPVLLNDALAPAPAALPANSGVHEFRSGLSPEERQALRDQVRGLNPNLLIEEGGLSESVAVNESYPDGVSTPIPGRGGDTGSNR